MERKWLNIELTQKDAESLHEYLMEMNFKHETSGCFELVHFEVLLNEEEEKQVNTWLDKHVFANAITERK